MDLKTSKKELMKTTWLVEELTVAFCTFSFIYRCMYLFNCMYDIKVVLLMLVLFDWSKWSSQPSYLYHFTCDRSHMYVLVWLQSSSVNVSFIWQIEMIKLPQSITMYSKKNIPFYAQRCSYFSHSDYWNALLFLEITFKILFALKRRIRFPCKLYISFL